MAAISSSKRGGQVVGASTTLSIALTAAALSPTAARADDAVSKPDKSAYSILAPTPDLLLRDLAPDRPTKAFSPITVDAGHFQIEMDLANYSYGTYQGVTTRTFVSADPVIKLGLTNFADLEIQIGGYQSVQINDAATPAGSTFGSGFGDTIVKTKINFIGNDGGFFALSVSPFVKIPSSTPLVSNGTLEGGVQIPLLFNLPNDFVLLSTPEFDVVKNANDFGTHAGYRVATSLTHPIPGVDKLSGSLEFFAMTGSDPAIPPIYTFDLDLSYMLTPATQLDCGLDIGLDKAAPALQIFAGITQRF